MARFREREDGVKAAVMGAYCALVAQATAAARRHYAEGDGASPLAALRKGARQGTPRVLGGGAGEVGGRGCTGGC